MSKELEIPFHALLFTLLYCFLKAVEFRRLIWELVMAYEITWVISFSKIKAKTEQEHFCWGLCLSFFPSTTRLAAAEPPVCKVACTLAVTNCATLHRRSAFQPILNPHPQKGPLSHPQLHSPDGCSPLPPCTPGPGMRRFWSVCSMLRGLRPPATGSAPVFQTDYACPLLCISDPKLDLCPKYVFV